jgi:hypothetical protein
VKKSSSNAAISPISTATMPSGQGGERPFVERGLQYTDENAAGTNPIHNKKPKKKVAEEEDEEDKAFKVKQAAGMDVAGLL